MKIKRPHRWRKIPAAERAQKCYKWVGVLTTAAFLSVGILGTVSSFVSPKQSACWETATRSTALFSCSDVWLTRRFPLHDGMVQAVTSSVTAMGSDRVGDVYVTEDRLFEYPQTLDKENLTVSARAIQSFYETYQIPTYVIAVPSAGEFYADDLLDGLSFPSQLSAIEYFYDSMSTAIRKIDVYHVLFTSTSDYIYNRTDPRWSCYGAYCVYHSAIRKMGFAPVAYDQYAITHASAFRGCLYEKSMYQQAAEDILDIYICENGYELTEMIAYTGDGQEQKREMFSMDYDLETDPYAFYLGGSCEKLMLRTNSNTSRKLLLFRDSYADCMVPFLLQHYSEICLIDVTCMQTPLTTLVDVEDYDQVLFLCDADTYNQSNWFVPLAKEG